MTTTNKRPPGVSRQIWDAYGDNYPGSPKRLAAAASARESILAGGDPQWIALLESWTANSGNWGGSK